MPSPLLHCLLWLLGAARAARHNAAWRWASARERVTTAEWATLPGVALTGRAWNLVPRARHGRLFGAGQAGNVTLLMAIVVVLVIVDRHSSGATLAATTVLWNPTARAAFALMGWEPVRLYGAKGDGSTDDTSPFQNAEDAANAAGGGTVVYARAAASYIVSTVTPRSNVTHLGAGGVLQHKTGTTNPMYYRPQTAVALGQGSTLTNVRWRDVHFEGEATAATEDARIAIYLRVGLSDAWVTDCRANGFASSAWWLSGQRLSVRDTNVTSCAMFAGGRNAINIVADATSVSDPTDPAAWGQAVVEGNKVDTTATAAIAVSMSSGGTGFYIRAAITANIVRNATNWAGIVCEANGSGHQASITGNIAARCKVGIESANTGGTSPQPADHRSFSIVGNTIDCEDLVSATGAQISSSYTVLQGNSIRSSGNCVVMGGIDSTHRALAQLVGPNQLANTNTSGTSPYFITGSWHDDSSVIGNRCTIETGATTRGFNFVDTNRIDVTDNHLNGSTRDGMTFSGGVVDATIKMNVIYDPNGSASTFSAISLAGAAGTTTLQDNVMVDRRGTPLMKYAIDASGVTSGSVRILEGNIGHGWVTASVNGRTNVTIDRGIWDTKGSATWDDTNGQVGALAPSGRGWVMATATLTSGRAFFARFVPKRDLTVTKIGFSVSTVDAGDPAVDVGIYDASLNQLVHSGATTGKLTATGPQTVTIAATTLKAGTVYYIAISSLSSTAVLVAANYANAQATRIYGAGVPTQEIGIGAADTYEPLPATASLSNNTSAVVLAVRES